MTLINLQIICDVKFKSCLGPQLLSVKTKNTELSKGLESMTITGRPWFCVCWHLALQGVVGVCDVGWPSQG